MIEDWSDFFVATVGAAAALAGLIIVAMTVNIQTILKSPSMPSRAGATIGSLVLLVVVGAASLIPSITGEWLGVAALVAVAGQAVFAGRSAYMLFRHDRLAPRGLNGVKAVLAVVEIVPFIIGGVLLVTGATSAGMVAVAIGFLLVFVLAAINAWVLLVEVLR
ncbi:hypothetical protein ACFSBZ_10805 [Amnibacterium flavum]|uniref:Modulator of FtsH protease n=1 Tax=Amnibacterium flavum TaxID=2173173 RepID=A0A2V1HRU9_9MICO|nr:hypothetical protein [Amnibacterium flavum]PVZ95323.1 hypothetical protein DDQ50_02030 [Amnibacterium flavum]